MDEVFGDENFVARNHISEDSGSSRSGDSSGNVCDYILWYAKNETRQVPASYYRKRSARQDRFTTSIRSGLRGVKRRFAAERDEARARRTDSIRCQLTLLSTVRSQRSRRHDIQFEFRGKSFTPPWNVLENHRKGMAPAYRAGQTLCSRRTRFDTCAILTDFPSIRSQHRGMTCSGSGFRPEDLCRSNSDKVIERCILMTTDPGDLVLDPTCGSGTTAYVAEQWGRRWITIDTSRVALALARARIMGARYPYYLLADSRDGQIKEAEVTRTAPVRSRCMATSATASSTSACRTSRSSPSPTTPRSMSSGTSGRRRWSRCARS